MSYEMLFNLVIGFKEWEEQKKKTPIPFQVHVGHRLFIYECSRNEVSPPVTLPELIQVLQKPSEEWGIKDIETIFPSDASLLDKEIGVTIEAEDFLEEQSSTDEFEQSEMKKILLYCRKHNLEDTYRVIRTFLANPKHSVISFQQWYEFKGKINDQELLKCLSSCYENIEDVDRYRVCPNCGWTLEWKKGAWRCNKENICHVLADFNDLRFFSKTPQKLMRMKSGIQKYTLLPGMSELRIAEKLRKRGHYVILYPNIDEYDILVQKGDKKSR